MKQWKGTTTASLYHSYNTLNLKTLPAHQGEKSGPENHFSRCMRAGRKKQVLWGSLNGNQKGPSPLWQAHELPQTPCTALGQCLNTSLALILRGSIAHQHGRDPATDTENLYTYPHISFWNETLRDVLNRWRKLLPSPDEQYGFPGQLRRLYWQWTSWALCQSLPRQWNGKGRKMRTEFRSQSLFCHWICL